MGLGSCSRTFASEPFGRQHFIIGDFFVADNSKVRFDTNMKLKEDYDYSCAHIDAHGSVMRCQRMTLSVKHYSNTGGAVTNRDNKGIEERRNIAILKKKWPNCFRDNPKRKNEVIMRWRRNAKDAKDDGAAEDDVDDDVDLNPGIAGSKKQRKKKACNTVMKKIVRKSTKAKKAIRTN